MERETVARDAALHSLYRCDASLRMRAFSDIFSGMSFAEVKELIPTLTAEERASLLEMIHAADEGVSVEEFRAINAAIEEALNDPGPGIPIEEVRKKLGEWARGDAD